MIRILYSGDPRGEDYKDAAEWTHDIRSRLTHIRGELEDLGRIEAMLPQDRRCNDVAGGLTLAIIALHSLVEGERSFISRATLSDKLWADVAANPQSYSVRDESSGWEWRPSGIYARGGPA